MSYDIFLRDIDLFVGRHPRYPPVLLQEDHEDKYPCNYYIISLVIYSIYLFLQKPLQILNQGFFPCSNMESFSKSFSNSHQYFWGNLWINFLSHTHFPFKPIL
mmetsp:Transcript_12947/g.16634  ORF Transcript_12947/g.16634 Transcript_12947/m.16634 type:complete len:103 (+) Transcript_12947:1822-2130(+)